MGEFLDNEDVPYPFHEQTICLSLIQDILRDMGLVD
jgi:hypothetical protein